MTTPNRDSFKKKGDFERWRKNNTPGLSIEEIEKLALSEPHPYTKDPNNPFNIMKREREIREAEEQ